MQDIEYFEVDTIERAWGVFYRHGADPKSQNSKRQVKLRFNDLILVISAVMLSESFYMDLNALCRPPPSPSPSPSSKGKSLAYKPRQSRSF
jgi:hypothetical protein